MDLVHPLRKDCVRWDVTSNIFTGDCLKKCTSPFDWAQNSKMSKALAIQDAARGSLTKFLRLLSAFVFDCGLSMSEANLILRTAAVQSAAVRQLQDKNRVNISGIAALTGIPRGEVSRILNSSENTRVEAIRARQNITSKILTAWHSDPDYLTASHRPRNLELFGNGQSFESLVKAYGQGIPVRAILDELKRVGAIELLSSSQKVSPKMPLAINPRITHKKIKDFDGATARLLLCLVSQSESSFVEKVFDTEVSSELVPRVRRRFGENSPTLLQKVQNKLEAKQANQRHNDPHRVARLSRKTICKRRKADLTEQSLKSRRNLHRNP
jgi:hypothetical protein